MLGGLLAGDSVWKNRLNLWKTSTRLWKHCGNAVERMGKTQMKDKNCKTSGNLNFKKGFSAFGAVPLE